MPKYRKKPIVVDGTEKSANAIVDWSGTYVDPDEPYPITIGYRGSRDEVYLDIHTKEGIMQASIGDYIIRGITGEFYPCNPKIFVATYDDLGG